MIRNEILLLLLLLFHDLQTFHTEKYEKLSRMLWIEKLRWLIFFYFYDGKFIKFCQKQTFRTCFSSSILPFPMHNFFFLSFFLRSLKGKSFPMWKFSESFKWRENFHQEKQSADALWCLQHNKTFRSFSYRRAHRTRTNESSRKFSNHAQALSIFRFSHIILFSFSRDEKLTNTASKLFPDG